MNGTGGTHSRILNGLENRPKPRIILKFDHLPVKRIC